MLYKVEFEHLKALLQWLALSGPPRKGANYFDKDLGMICEESFHIINLLCIYWIDFSTCSESTKI